MRELSFGDNKIGIRGGVVCRLFLYKEFGEEEKVVLRCLRRGDIGARTENTSASSAAFGKKLGFLPSELNEMSVQGFLDVLGAYAEDGKGSKDDGGETAKQRRGAQCRGILIGTGGVEESEKD